MTHRHTLVRVPTIHGCPSGADKNMEKKFRRGGGQAALWYKHRGPECQCSELTQEVNQEVSLDRERSLMTKDLDEFTSKNQVVKRKQPFRSGAKAMLLFKKRNKDEDCHHSVLLTLACHIRMLYAL